MKRIFWGVAAILGVLCALMVHGSLMVVEQEGSEMLPTLEPGQHVLVYLLEEDFKEGDVVAFEPPYYTVGGGSGIELLRVKSIENDSFVLTCDADLTSENQITVVREDILGKAVIYG